MAKKISVEFNISGHVQGVGYRWFAYQKANDLGLKGFAKNEYDGTVTVVVEGDERDIQQLEHYLRQGPSHSLSKSYAPITAIIQVLSMILISGDY